MIRGENSRFYTAGLLAGILGVIIFATLLYPAKRSKAVTLHINSADVSVYFSPDGGATDAIVKEINHAHSTIDIAMYDLTSKPIAQAIMNAEARGVKIRMVMDRKEADTRYSYASFFARNGIPVKLLPVYRDGLMHNKFAVIDNDEVITGSFNWTYSAEHRNYENLLIIRSPQLAQVYEKYFEKMYERGRNDE